MAMDDDAFYLVQTKALQFVVVVEIELRCVHLNLADDLPHHLVVWN